MKLDIKTGLAVIGIVAIGAFSYAALTTREHRSVGQKIDDAVGQLDNGLDNAARELKDRTPVEKARDAVKDATDGREE